jgi:hypothetical protein
MVLLARRWLFCLLIVTTLSFGPSGVRADDATLSVILSGDAFGGPPAFSISFNGDILYSDVVKSAFVTEIDKGYRDAGALASRAETFSFTLPSAAFDHFGNVRIDFLNDAFGGGGTGLDRNLYVLDVVVNGTHVRPVDWRLLEKTDGSLFLASGSFVALFSSNTAAIALAPPNGWPASPAAGD